jgi:hypothetical protein
LPLHSRYGSSTTSSVVKPHDLNAAARTATIDASYWTVQILYSLCRLLLAVPDARHKLLHLTTTNGCVGLLQPSRPACHSRGCTAFLGLAVGCLQPVCQQPMPDWPATRGCLVTCYLS